ncbi:serine hydrolase [Winogradskyella maritima]|uniref:Serine hydrolase domain-containing protein n=1 Tax=Winogradskyella maritima TaxID=1517766 RepID=A0ABV8AGL3_9FLAO|nr:serine hydrolase [Winogradskyella maritima]
MRYLAYIFVLCCIINCSSTDPLIEDDSTTIDSVYFPPIDSDEWESESVSNLNWDTNALQPLLDFLEQKNSKSFIILYNGKIVVENYFNNHTLESSWYWASAGKTLTTALTGIAANEGLLDIDAKISDYIGDGWTDAPTEKENLITVKHLLSMTSGLDDSMGQGVSNEDLTYVADAGSRWAYHNVYKKLQDVVASTSNSTWNNYFNSSLKTKIGMTGAWIENSDFNVYWSNARSMARFGLLMANQGNWDGEQIIPADFLSDATNTSQNLNKSYGYLWWLNGKSSYRLPQSQFEFTGSLIPSAPDDMYAALGRDDQKIYVIPSKKLVVIRMGNAADDSNFALSNFDDEFWIKIKALIN